MTAVLLALGTSVLYGAASFQAGGLSRRVPAALLALWSQVAAAGVVGAAGVLIYYRRLASGPTSLVAPLAGAGAAVPVVVGIARGDAPGALVLAGLAVVLLGLGLASIAPGGAEPASAPAPCKPRLGRTPSDRGPRSGTAIPLALLAALSFGGYIVLLAAGSANAAGRELWVTMGVQLGALPTGLLAALASRRGEGRG